MTAIDNLLALVDDNSSKTSRESKYTSMLDAETVVQLDKFVEWLVAQNKTSATASSYKSYVAKALALELDWSDMSSDVRSAVKKFAEFAKS